MRGVALPGLGFLVVAAACGGGGAGGQNDNQNVNQSSAVCGDGVVSGGEECDEGVLNSDPVPDACRTNCRRARCGDGTLDSDELCDDGAQNSDRPGAGCRLTCTLPSCGDGVVDPGELCDDGPANSACQPDACRPTCLLPTCGDGVIDPGRGEICGDPSECSDCSEACADCDGDGYGDGPGCFAADCDDADPLVVTNCGDPCTPQSCPDGCCQGGSCVRPAQQNRDACGTGAADCAACTGELACMAGTCEQNLCGNGQLDPGEVCDDGNTDALGDCNATCSGQGSLPNGACGNGVLEAGEDCDDGNLRSRDGCSSGCTEEVPTWTKGTGTSPAARELPAVAYDPIRGAVILHGGYDGVTLGDTWRYDGAWTDISSVPAPGPSAGAMAFDAVRGVLVLFRGWLGTSSYSNETWEHDGMAWTQRTPATLPLARAHTAVAYDEARGRLVLFGGLDGIAFGDTWEYDGVDWIETTPALSPGARLEHRLVYDPLRQRVVLFGGSALGFPNYAPLGDTWEYDGTSWVNTTPSLGPAGRFQGSLTFDPLRGRVVLAGGSGGVDGPDFQDTWEYDGTTWSPLAPVGAFTSGSTPQGAYDPIRRTLVIFGGYVEPGGAHAETQLLRWTSAWPDEICDSGADDDSDGLIDCADPDCDLFPLCP